MEVSSGSASVIHNNTGIDGGGLALYGDSYLLLENGSLLTFTNNTAQRGGAMFVETSTISLFNKQQIEPCFYQFPSNSQSRSGKVTFSGNQATIAGSVLFGNTICVLFSSLDWCDGHSIDCFNKTFDYSEQNGPSVLSFEPFDVCFCESNTANCSNYKHTPLNIQAYPGEVFNISLVTVGVNGGVTPGTVVIEPDNPSARPELYNTTALNCTNISLTAVNMSTKYSVFPLGSSFPVKKLTISLSRCPPGFKVSNETGVCSCGEELTIANLQDKLITCDAATNTLARQGDVWIGNINTSNYTTSECIVAQTPCPFDYCKTSRVNFTLAEPDPQCALNRSGIMCGKCQNNLSLALGSNNCIECPTDQQLYLSLVLPFAVAGLGLIVLLMVLNLTVSVGTLNGLIFYASIIQISESTGIFFHRSIPVLSQFIAWLNLDLGIEICFYKEMTGYQKVWLQFVFPLYIWFIIVTIIILCRYSKWLSIKIGGNVVQVLATLILLSFTKIFRTFAPALAWLSFHCSNSTEPKTLWYVDGNLDYLSPSHLLLIVAAVLFLLLAVPYTLALLFDPLIEKYLTRFRLFRKWWIKFKPFVDAYYGPYKDNCRFWTGLLLLVRMVFTLVSVYLDTYTMLVFITTSSSVLLSLMVIFGGIYQNNYLNVLECSSLLNLALLSAIYNPWYDTAKDTRTEVSVTIISVSIALVTFVGVIVYHVILRIQNVKCLKKITWSKTTWLFQS